MTSEQFTYWLKGFIEMNPAAMLTHTQWEILKDHLNLVFKKETPLRIPSIGTPGFTVTGPSISDKTMDALRQQWPLGTQITC